VRLPEPATVELHTLFISSSDEPTARRIRQRVKRLVDDVICPSLRQEYPESRVTLEVDMWERTAAQKAAGNAIFVERARASGVALVLIFDELRAGTKEELEAVVDEADVEVSLLSFDPSRNADPEQRKKVERVIRKYRGQLFYKRVGKPNSDDAWFELSRQLFAFAFAAMRKSDDRVPETAPLEVRKLGE
jgi:hypothetical protein